MPARVDRFEHWVDRSTADRVDATTYDHTDTVNDYYDLCSQFMERFWSASLQFAPLTPDETLEQSIFRHQGLMISKLRLEQGMTIADFGCGFGTLMRRVAQETGVRVVGINNNEQQLEKARVRNREAGLHEVIDCLKCNIMDMRSIEAESFDRGYAIESTCHTPSRATAYAQIFRLLKPGAYFWCQEMCVTNRFDPNSRDHQAIKQELMQYIALKEIPGFAEVNEAVEIAGFEIVEAGDRGQSDGPTVPWYAPMEGRHGGIFDRAIRAPRARPAVFAAARAAEAARVFPRGSARVIRLMGRAADAYVAGGAAGIFTPLYCFLARKPA